MIERLDAKDRLVTHAARIITGPFTERTFGKTFVRHRVTFNSDFGMSRYRQAGDGTADHLDRLVLESAGVIELRNMLRHGCARSHVNDRLRGEDDLGGGRVASLGGIFLCGA